MTDSDTKIEKEYFGTDGIRGRANQFPMTAKMALKVAMAAALVMQEQNAADDKHKPTNRVVIGKDTRLSGYMLEQAMAAGFVSMGMEVVLTGPVPTPAVAMLTRSLRCDLGVMISASHNPYYDNGIKLFGADGFKLDDAVERQIEIYMDSNLDNALAGDDKLGKASRLDDAPGRYVEYVKRSLRRRDSLAGLKIVVDAAHGAAYKVAPQVLWELEADVVTIGDTPDGRNINDGYGATATEDLQQAVVEHKADVGLALDGDADRLILVDEKGTRIDGDQIMAALTLAMHEKGTLQGGGLVATVMSNLGLEKLLESKGLKLIRTAVGDRHVVEAMRADGYNIGGEQSGHLILSDFGTTGDGLLSALQALSLLKSDGRAASEVFHQFAPYPQMLKNVRFDAEAPLEDDAVKKVIAAAEEKLAGSGRILVRASGTEPVIRVMAEGQDESLIDTLTDEICDAVSKAA